MHLCIIHPAVRRARRADHRPSDFQSTRQRHTEHRTHRTDTGMHPPARPRRFPPAHVDYGKWEHRAGGCADPQAVSPAQRRRHRAQQRDLHARLGRNGLHVSVRPRAPDGAVRALHRIAWKRLEHLLPFAFTRRAKAGLAPRANPGQLVRRRQRAAMGVRGLRLGHYRRQPRLCQPGSTKKAKADRTASPRKRRQCPTLALLQATEKRAL